MYMQIGAISVDDPQAPRTDAEETWMQAQDPDALVEVLEGDSSLVYAFDTTVTPPTLASVLALLEAGEAIVCRADWELLAALPAQVQQTRAYWRGEVVLALPEAPE